MGPGEGPSLSLFVVRVAKSHTRMVVNLCAKHCQVMGRRGVGPGEGPSLYVCIRARAYAREGWKIIQTVLGDRRRVYTCLH